MKRWVGRWLIAVAFVHTAGGIYDFREDVAGIIGNGIFNTVTLGSEYFGAYFSYCGACSAPSWGW